MQCPQLPRNFCCAREAEKRSGESQQLVSTPPYSNTAIQWIRSAIRCTHFWSRFTIGPTDSCSNGVRKSKTGLVPCGNSLSYLRAYQTSAWESVVFLLSQSYVITADWQKVQWLCRGYLVKLRWYGFGLDPCIMSSTLVLAMGWIFWWASFFYTVDQFCHAYRVVEEKWAIERDLRAKSDLKIVMTFKNTV